jgi:hypothetical protein
MTPRDSIQGGSRYNSIAMEQPENARVRCVFALILPLFVGCGQGNPSAATDNAAQLGTLSHGQLESRHGGTTAGEWSRCVETGNCGEVHVQPDSVGATHLYWSNWWTLWIWTNEADVVVRVCVPDAPEEAYTISRDRFWRAHSAIPVALGMDVRNRMIAEQFYAERRAAQQISPHDNPPTLRIWTEPTGKLPGLKIEGGETTCWEVIPSEAKTRKQHRG